MKRQSGALSSPFLSICVVVAADLKYFLKEICDAEYSHEAFLAPTSDILEDFKNKKMSWEEYRRKFMALLAKREVDSLLDRRLFAVPAILLCSEPTAEHCHRRLVAEFLQSHWGNVDVIHL